MLFEEQAAELLKQCEEIAGKRLTAVRGNLHAAKTRAHAVWELIVFHAAAQVGRANPEPVGGGPDIRLQVEPDRWVSIETTYVPRRFESESDRQQAVVRWIADLSQGLADCAVALQCRFGGRRELSGTRLTLPAEHEKDQFLKRPELVSFLKVVRSNPGVQHVLKFDEYSLELVARRRTVDDDEFVYSHGPILEFPTDATEHAVYRALKKKAAQHKPDEPYVVCKGSDVNSLMKDSNLGGHVPLTTALVKALRQSTRVSGVLIVSIDEEGSMSPYERKRQARSTLYRVPDCSHPLSDREFSALLALNFNHWKYTWPLSKHEIPVAARRPLVSGSMKTSSRRNGCVKLTVPAYLIVDALAGRRTLSSEFSFPNRGDLSEKFPFIQDGWRITSCQMIPGDVVSGVADAVELELAPPHEPVYWKKPDHHSK